MCLEFVKLTPCSVQLFKKVTRNYLSARRPTGHTDSTETQSGQIKASRENLCPDDVGEEYVAQINNP